MSVATARSSINEAFAGIDGSAVVIIAVVALINTIRRSINSILEPPFSEWLFGTAVGFVESLILGVLVVLAVAWTVNRTSPGWRQYAAAGIAVIVATGVGTALLVIFERPAWEADPRLAVEIDVPEVLRDAAMPSLMIVTLVENAIKHGVGPQPGGGRIAIRASTDGHAMTVEVADTGRGFVHASGGGTGLANIRSRLAALFGRDASLSLRINAPHGIVATIALPRRVSRPEERDEYARAA